MCFIIAKVRGFDVRTASSDPDASPLDDDDVDAAAFEDRPSDPVEAELKSFISNLSDGARIDLVAIAWMRRGDGPDRRAEAKDLAFSQRSDRTTEYFAGTPLLPDHQEDGQATTCRSCSEHEAGSV